MLEEEGTSVNAAGCASGTRLAKNGRGKKV